MLAWPRDGLALALAPPFLVMGGEEMGPRLPALPPRVEKLVLATDDGE